MKTKEQLIDELIDLAFAEDIGDGDHTTLCCIPDTAMGKSRLLIKEPGILAGVEIARKIFHRFDPDLKMTVYIEDGTAVKPGDVAFVVEGRVQSLLQTERLMLNVMQRMSGIATMTHRYVKNSKVCILAFSIPARQLRACVCSKRSCEDRWWRESSYRIVRHDFAER